MPGINWNLRELYSNLSFHFADDCDISFQKVYLKDMYLQCGLPRSACEPYLTQSDGQNCGDESIVAQGVMNNHQQDT